MGEALRAWHALATASVAPGEGGPDPGAHEVARPHGVPHPHGVAQPVARSRPAKHGGPVGHRGGEAAVVRAGPLREGPTGASRRLSEARTRDSARCRAASRPRTRRPCRPAGPRDAADPRRPGAHAARRRRRPGGRPRAAHGHRAGRRRHHRRLRLRAGPGRGHPARPGPREPAAALGRALRRARARPRRALGLLPAADPRALPRWPRSTGASTSARSAAARRGRGPGRSSRCSPRAWCWWCWRATACCSWWRGRSCRWPSFFLVMFEDEHGGGARGGLDLPGGHAPRHGVPARAVPPARAARRGSLDFDRFGAAAPLAAPAAGLSSCWRWSASAPRPASCRCTSGCPRRTRPRPATSRP